MQNDEEMTYKFKMDTTLCVKPTDSILPELLS